MLTLQQIINEADLLVASTISVADKVQQLNAINQDFFNGVKIPKLARFTTTMQAAYTLPDDVRSKNIDMVQVGMLLYNSLDNAAVNPAQNAYAYDDDAGTLTLSPAPYQHGLLCTVRYRKVATSSFTTASLGAVPDAPAEYHWTYVPALAAWVAKAEDDAEKASRYEAQYLGAWNKAQQEHQGGTSR